MPDTSFHPLDHDLRHLDEVCRAAATPDFLRMAIRGAYRGRIALAVSRGAAATVLLHMIAGIDRNTPVIVLGPSVESQGLRDVREVTDLDSALGGFEAWIDGRQRSGPYGHRTLVDIINGRLKLDPLARWSAQDIAAYLRANSLPGARWRGVAGVSDEHSTSFRTSLH